VCEKVPLSLDHLNSNKFSNPNDHNYKKIRNALVALVQEAGQKMKQRANSKIAP
jgi:hypothetical protein